MNKVSKREAIVGCILGTAVGDALGLPYEGVSSQRAPKLLGPPDRYRFLFGRGMISDDTEHTCMVAQSLIEANGDVDIFTKRFASRLRWWILAFPAGVGKATARSGIKLWLGAKPQNAGVFSAGNGPAMRAAVFGAAIDDCTLLLHMVRASSRLTHSDPKAEYGAIAVALAAKHSRDNETADANLWLEQVAEAVGNEGVELTDLLRKADQSIRTGESTPDFAQGLGLGKGVTGYTYHTVPVAIHAWLAHPKDFRQAVATIIRCGGDADTTAAIVGGIVGAGVGREGGEGNIPEEWIDGLCEWPRSVTWMRSLGESLAASIDANPTTGTKPPSINPLGVLLRNLLFLLVVLFHGFRRLAPPY
ncbi:ADP-ribosyl-[dinitrogen reductase] glycohydrolase [Roseimaritima multifibrata]|uniref:ADP-ribosyl-[dinitrogen reductase] glycohydrolase n=1 Tax=Roseimaritima multifibrata TaxID=1930274 RepID=A0A517MIE3_9BACT|nr:ADP-ribosylglycohydrolase family protein [Roseimaritima multifibrata]QDS94640.1 ADP-ribosyl-[dinitrogen reductase] glycohydrolase [Roseimaritima multifibrata]